MSTPQTMIQTVSFIVLQWRRGRDSNPRRRLSRSGFQDRRNRPLCHLSEMQNAKRGMQNEGCSADLIADSSFFVLRSSFSKWQGGRDSNPQPTVLETATLPIELPPYAITSVTRPAPM